jgi:LPPG:FO 2-phospho-L-lactate transferase
MKVTALAGGVGGAKLLIGLDQLDADTTAIVNTADDTEMYGMHVSPDIDICTYWLAGLADTERGWGIRGDTFEVIEALGKLGVESWFRLGDRDLATCLRRTELLTAGETLTGATEVIRRALEVEMTLIPMSDEPVRTRIGTADGRTLDFQEYFVKHRCEPEVSEVRFAGIADAKPAPGVIESIRGADLVVLCPSNPVVSLGPILALPEVRETLIEHPRVAAVSPIIAGEALKGPAAEMMRAQGTEVTATGVAGLYADLLDIFVIDGADRDQTHAIEDLGIGVVVTDTVMTDPQASLRVAAALL